MRIGFVLAINLAFLSYWSGLVTLSSPAQAAPSGLPSYSNQTGGNQLDLHFEHGTYEDTEEFLGADDPSIPEAGIPETPLDPRSLAPSELPEPLDELLIGLGEWSYQFVYFPKNGPAVPLTQYRAHEFVKPASLLKIFTGWMAYEKNVLAPEKLSFMLQTSNNPLADSTFNRMGAQRTFRQFFQNALGVQLDPKTAQIYNGSGNPVYIRKRKYNSWMINRLILQLLEHILRSEEYHSFKMSLAMPGQRGTLKSRFLDLTPYPLYAKTGTLNSVANLAGFVDLKRGTLAFTVVSDSLKSIPLGREAIDGLVVKYIQAAQKTEQNLQFIQNSIFPPGNPLGWGLFR